MVPCMATGTLYNTKQGQSRRKVKLGCLFPLLLPCRTPLAGCTPSMEDYSACQMVLPYSYLLQVLITTYFSASFSWGASSRGSGVGWCLPTVAGLGYCTILHYFLHTLATSCYIVSLLNIPKITQMERAICFPTGCWLTQTSLFSLLPLDLGTCRGLCQESPFSDLCSLFVLMLRFLKKHFLK